VTESKLSVEARATLPAPDGTPLGNLRHVVAAFADSDPREFVVRATANVWKCGPGVYTTASGATWTGLTHGDLRALLAMIDGGP
jgi:hypothetical protein